VVSYGLDFALRILGTFPGVMKMPNRGELAIPMRRPSTKAVAAQADAWPIVAFCTLGFMMSLYMAVTSMGLDALLPRLTWG
jgi:hypothetical protein